MDNLDTKLKRAVADFTIGLNLVLRQISAMEEEARVTGDKALAARAGEALRRLDEHVAETGREVERICGAEGTGA